LRCAFGAGNIALPRLQVQRRPKEARMKKLLLVVSLAVAAGTAFAHNCPNEMKAIDAKLATNPKLSEADAAKVKKLRADGEAAHKAGKHDDSMKALGEAKKMLAI
jgi:hypothetical protein